MTKKKEPYREPSSEETKRHWSAQEVSVFRKPKSRDKGLTVVTSPDHVKGIVDAEIQQGPQNTFKLKTPPSIVIEDPMLHVQSMIRMSKDMEAEEFMLHCTTPLDLALYEYLYGDMRSAQRGMGLLKLNEAIFKAQQEAMKQVNIQQARDDKREAKLINAQRTMKYLRQIKPTDEPSKGD